MTTQTQPAHESGTKDKAYNLVWYVEECLKHTQRLGEFAADADAAGDRELADFFRHAQSATRETSEKAKSLLGQRLVAA